MGNGVILISSRYPSGREAPNDGGLTGRGLSPLSHLRAILVFAGILVTTVTVRAAENGPGIVIYTTLDHGSDETAFAVPFIKAERFALVTNVTTADGKSVRVTNNQMKELVYPPDLTKATVTDDAGVAALHQKLAEYQALQERFPRTHVQLTPIINELDRVVRLLEEGNVLVTGRLLSREDHESQAALKRATTVDLTLNGVIYKGAKLTSVSGEKISIMHSGGVASVTVGQLSDDQIARLNGTNPNVAVVRPAIEPPVPVPDPIPAPNPIVATPGPAQSPVAASPELVDTAKSSDHPTATLSPVENALPDGKTEEQPIDEAVALKLREVDPQVAGRLVAILRSCQDDVEKIFAGHGALSDITAFPGGRFGSMSYDDAMREVNLQKGRVNDALLYQGILLNHLRELKVEAENGKGVSPELREWISGLANVPKTSLEDLLGLVGVSAKVAWLLEELAPLVPEGQEEIAQVQSPQSSDSGSIHRRPLFVIIVVLLVLAGAAAFVTIHLTRRKRSEGPAIPSPSAVMELARSRGRVPSRQDQPGGRTGGMPMWGWATVAGATSVVVVAGLIAYVTRNTPSPSVAGRDRPVSPENGPMAEEAKEQFSRGVAYRMGTGVEADPAEAFRCFKRAAELGHAEAQTLMGQAFASGIDTEQDFAAAADWFRRAAEQGHSVACMEYGTLLFYGKGVPQNRQEGLKWTELAGEDGVLFAQKILGVLYGGVEGVDPDPDLSFKWTRLAAEQGDAEAQFRHGTHYIDGIGISVDPVEGWSWIERSAAAGYPPAVTALQGKERQGLAIEMLRQSAQGEPYLLPRPEGSNPFSRGLPTENIPPIYEEGKRRAYEALRQQGYSDEVLRQQGYR